MQAFDEDGRRVARIRCTIVNYPNMDHRYFALGVNYPDPKEVGACHSNSKQPLNSYLADDYRLIDAALYLLYSLQH